MHDSIRVPILILEHANDQVVYLFQALWVVDLAYELLVGHGREVIDHCVLLLEECYTS